METGEGLYRCVMVKLKKLRVMGIPAGKESTDTPFTRGLGTGTGSKKNNDGSSRVRILSYPRSSSARDHSTGLPNKS